MRKENFQGFLGMLALIIAIPFTAAASASRASTSTCFQTTVQRNDTIVTILDRVNDKYPNATFVEICFGNNLTTLPGCLLPSPGMVLKYDCGPIITPSNATWEAFLDQGEAALANGTASLKAVLGAAAAKLSNDDLTDLANAIDTTLGSVVLDESALTASANIDQPTAAKYGRDCYYLWEKCCGTEKYDCRKILWWTSCKERCINSCIPTDFGYGRCQY